MVLAFERIQRFGDIRVSVFRHTISRDVYNSEIESVYSRGHSTLHRNMQVSSFNSPCGSKRSHCTSARRILSTRTWPRLFVFIFLPSLSINLPAWFPFHPHLNCLPISNSSSFIYIPGFLLYIWIYNPPCIQNYRLAMEELKLLYTNHLPSPWGPHTRRTGNPSTTTTTKHGRSEHHSETKRVVPLLPCKILAIQAVAYTGSIWSSIAPTFPRYVRSRYRWDPTSPSLVYL